MSKRKEDFEETETAKVASAKKIKADDVSSSTESLSDPENRLLANLMAYHMREVNRVSFKKCATDLGFMVRTKSYCKAWSQLIEKGLIVSCEPGGAKTSADHRLTEAGKAHASTPEYEEFVKDKTFVAATNQDHQDRIKKRLVNDKSRQRGVQIFDLLLEHGALTRKELCAILNVRSGTHSFSYGLKDLKDKELVAGVGSEKLRLTDKAFLDPETDRPTHMSDQETIDALVSKSKYAGETQKSRSNKSNKKKTKESSTATKTSVPEDDSGDSSKEDDPKDPALVDESQAVDDILDDDTVATDDAEKVSS